MAPSRSGSPARGSSPEPDLLLSPRSRMEARLAAMDTSSEDEKDDPSPAPVPVPALRRRPNASDMQTATKPIDASDESSEEDIRPRGRFAAQMQAKHSPEGSTSHHQAGKTAPSDALTEPAARDATAADSDSEDLPVAPRRMKRKQASAAASSAPSSPAPPPSSPGLFVSPAPAPATAAPETNDANGSGTDEEFPAVKNPRFQALVERKRQERLAREAEEERQREEKRARQAELDGRAFDNDDGEEDGNSSSITDDEGGRKLTQEARPTRKAGKKAVEEMNRETQRMARNMQLAHEAKTRKKITKASLFERFNFKTNSGPAAALAAPGPEPKTTSSSRPTTPVSATHTDTEMKDVPDTPPSSPPLDALKKSSANEERSEVKAISRDADDSDGDLPTLAEMLGQTTSPKRGADTEKGKGKDKGKAVDGVVEPAGPAAKPKRHFRVKLPQIAVNRAAVGSNDEDELEITTTRKNRLDAIFDRVPEKKAKEASSLHALRLLAQVKSPGKASRKANNSSNTSSMTPGELEFTLYQRARQQARMERERRLEMLKAKGVIVQTEEEREKEMQDVEDIVSRARKEAEEIMEKEREAAKLEKRRKIQNGELDPMAWDDSEDEEYEGSDEGQEDEPELSGSDDENSAAEDGEENPLVDGEADEDADEDADDSDKGTTEEPQRQEPDSDDEVELPRKNIRRPKKKALVISDDEEEEGGVVEATPKPKTTATHKSPPTANTDSPAAPTSVLRSAKKSFIPGLPVAGPAGLGLTQIFAGTMDDSQAVAPASGWMASPMPSFGGFPNFDNVSQEDDAHVNDSMILDSQGGDTQKAPTLNGEETQGIQLHYTQSQMHGFDSLLPDDEDRVAATQVSMEPSQDGGLADYTPLRERFVEPPVSTAQTVVLDRAVDDEAGADVDGDAAQDSPLVRRGRLRRKMASIAEEPLPATATSTMPTEEDVPPTATAFGVMANAAQKEKRSKDKAEYNKKKSKAKDMFQEQAEESEDEYAGLGGADGEDSSDDDAASVKEMIDDEERGQNDEGQIAALHADRERARDEQMVDKLFHDITTGMLRRKRGADYDLSDSDDGGEARRRLKRRQFAKMQKALFADERIKKIAEKPGNQAFLRTIEDRGSDEEMDFLDVGPEPTDTDESSSQSQSQPHTREHPVADSQAPANTRNPLTTTMTEGNRQPAKSRRTKDGKRPSNIGEIRDSVSSLLEEPADASVIPGTMVGSDHSDAGEGGDDDKDDDGHHAQHSTEESTRPAAHDNPRRTAGAKPAVIDRMSLKRDSSSTSNLSTSSRLAFAMPSGSGSSSFKVPALLRRATTNSLAGPGTISSGNGSGASGRSSFGGEGKIKKTAGKRSGVSALARETERRAAMQENEKRREARKWKGAEKRGRAVGGLFGAGKFE